MPTQKSQDKKNQDKKPQDLESPDEDKNDLESPDEDDDLDDDLDDEDDDESTEDEDEDDDEGLGQLFAKIPDMMDGIFGSFARSIQALSLDNMICSKIADMISGHDFVKPLPDDINKGVQALVTLRTTLFGQGIPMLPANVMNPALRNVENKE